MTSTNDESGEATSQTTFRLRFSLLALFLLMTGACFLLAWFAQPRQCTVEALFLVSSQELVLLGERAPFDAEEVDRFRQNQLEFGKSVFVIQAAVRDPKIAALAVLAGRDDPVQWIIDNLEFEFREGSEVLAIRMHGPEGAGDDLRQIVDAVSKAYLEEVVLAEEQRRNVMRDALAKSHQKLADELRTKMEFLQDEIAKSGDDNPDVKLRQLEIDGLTDIFRQSGLQLEILDVNSLAPARVRMIQMPVTTSE